MVQFEVLEALKTAVSPLPGTPPVDQLPGVLQLPLPVQVIVAA
jgi:hypothetical protein